MKLHFCGAVRGVTGSCLRLEHNKRRILVDCGMHQGEDADQYAQEAFLFDPTSIEAVVLTHAHYDHCGRIPMLVSQGFSGPVYCTAPTKALARLVLEDAQHVMRENHERMGTPILFSQEDVERADDLMRVMNYHTEFQPIPGVRIHFNDAGHILGSAYAVVRTQNKTLVISGDLGNDGVPILADTEPISQADAIITESTYGDRVHEADVNRDDLLHEMIMRVVKRGGTLLIPAFSIERTQELLYELDRMADAGEMPDVPIFLDSPLAIRATEVYAHFSSYLRFDRKILASPDRDFFSFPHLRVTMSVDDSKRINDVQGPKIIIAGSGMMTGGRIIHHLKRYIDNARNGILIIGYQAEGTLGRRILNKEPRVSIYNDSYDLKAEVKAIGAFSAHADKNKLLRWLMPEQEEAKQIFLVHGELSAKEALKASLEAQYASEVNIPQYDQVFEI